VIATPPDIKLILERILTLSTPTLIYLFGSQARGQAHVHSDIDLLIVEPTTLPRQHRGRALTAALRGFAASFDLLFYTPDELAEELDDPLSFASTAVAGSRVLYAVPDGNHAPYLPGLTDPVTQRSLQCDES
jgi:predicted nucleotidyltransferase